MPIFQDPVAFRKLISAFTAHIISCYGTVDVVVGLDARGFLFGPALALQLNAAFVPVRKAGKLPGKCVTVEYMKEYGKDLFAMQQHAIEPRQRVIIVDDIIATGKSQKIRILTKI